MKKTLVALAVIAVSGTAFAQSTVTLSGTFGSAYQSYDSTAAGVVTKNKGLAPVTDASIKATVVEDLGGGLKVTAAGQFALNASRGGNLTKEDSSVALAGGFGTIAFTSTRSSDTAIAANVFASWTPITAFYATVSSRSAGDVFSYTSPAIIPGLNVGISQFEATEGVTTSAVKITTLSASYVNGPLRILAAQKSTSGLTAAQIAAGSKDSNTELAAIYNLGFATVGLGFDGSTTSDATSHLSKNMTSYGISIPMGAITIGVNGAKRGKSDFYDAGINYDLSKRTSVRLNMGKMTGGTNNGNQTRVGIFHTF